MPQPVANPQPLLRRERGLLALLFALFLASRIAWILGYPASITYWEESSRWVATNELLNGPFHPLLAYQADNYQGGSLVMTLATAAAMKLFGQSVFVFKAVSVAVGALTMGLLVAVARRAYGSSAALAAAALYVAGPPLVAVWSLVQLGSHPEGLLFSLLAMLLFLRLAPDRDDARAWDAKNWDAKNWALFGFVSGAGLWFSPTTAFGPAACALSWLLLYGFPTARNLGSALLGGLLGLVPWMAAIATSGSVALERVAQIFGYGDAMDSWLRQSLSERIVAIATHDFPRGAMLVAEDGIAPSVTYGLALGCLLLFGWALGRMIVRGVRAVAEARSRTTETIDCGARADTLFAVHSVLFFAAMIAIDYSVSRPEPVHFRFYLSWIVPMLVPVAAAFTGANRRDATPQSVTVRRVRPGTFAFALWLVISAAATHRYLIAHADDHAPLASSNGYTIQGLLVYQKAPHDLGQALAFGDRITDASLRHSFDFGVGWGITVHVHSPRSAPQQLMDTIEGLPSATRAGIYAGLDWTVKRQLKTWPDDADPAALPPAERRYRFVLKALQRHVETAFESISAQDQWRGKTPREYPGYFPDDEAVAARQDGRD